VALVRSPNFSKHIAEAVVAAFALNLFLGRFELSVAIERLERFQPSRCCSEAIAFGKLTL
jgi:hypothetical protein